MTTLTDLELITRLEDSSIADTDFHHPEHVRAAFLYLRRYPLIDALQRLSTVLRQRSASRGRPERYHETVTWAYMFLVHQRMSDGDQTWESFAEANPDLLDWQNSILKQYYRPETLESAHARKRFLLPDKNL